MKKRNWSPDVAVLGDRIATLTATGAAELSAYLEAVHGIQAACPQAVVREIMPDVVIGPEPAEPTLFAVVLDEFDPARRVAVIKAVRELTGLGLKDARDAVETCPRVVRDGLCRTDAEAVQAVLQGAGAKTSLRGHTA